MNLQTIMDKLRALEKRVEQLEAAPTTLVAVTQQAKDAAYIEGIVAQRRGRPPKELTDGR